MTQGVNFTRRLAEAARSMQGEAGSTGTLGNALSFATDIIVDCDLAGISILDRGRIDTPAGSCDVPRELHALQLETSEGPCLDALREQETVRSGDLATDERWPTWGPRVADEYGVNSILCFRLFTTADVLGALNLYSYKQDAFDAVDVENGLALAAHVAVALAGARHIEHLERAVTARTLIGQAQGILMERFGLSPARAFEVLRRVSQESNTKLNTVAEELVHTRQTPTGSRDG